MRRQHDSEKYELSDAEKRDLIKLICYIEKNLTAISSNFSAQPAKNRAARASGRTYQELSNRLVV